MSDAYDDYEARIQLAEHAWEKRVDETVKTEQKPVAWQPIESAPKTGRKVILFYKNRLNVGRTVIARWLTDEQATEIDADDVGLEGGWYECIDNWDDFTEVAIHEGEPSHWMPLPAPPIEALRQAQPEKEPVAWRYALDASVEGPRWIYIDKDPHQWLQGPAMVNAAVEELHTSPQPSKPWVGLTDKDIDDCYFAARQPDFDIWAFAQEVEEVLKQKNT
jgi:hypothetical protein